MLLYKIKDKKSHAKIQSCGAGARFLKLRGRGQGAGAEKLLDLDPELNNIFYLAQGSRKQNGAEIGFSELWNRNRGTGDGALKRRPAPQPCKTFKGADKLDKKL